jgi:hypothetical protein
LRRRVEEIKRHNTVKEYRKHFKYTKNLTKEYEPRNLNILDVNGQLLSENKKKWWIEGGNICKENEGTRVN